MRCVCVCWNKRLSLVTSSNYMHRLMCFSGGEKKRIHNVNWHEYTLEKWCSIDSVFICIQLNGWVSCFPSFTRWRSIVKNFWRFPLLLVNSCFFHCCCLHWRVCCCCDCCARPVRPKLIDSESVCSSAQYSTVHSLCVCVCFFSRVK